MLANRDIRTSKTPLVFAHRGVSSEFPENTLEAFGAARFRGADGVELDARRLADGGIAVHHDPRLADGRAIVDLTRKELPATVPLLGDALQACEGLVVNIELKNLPGEPDFDLTNDLTDRVVDEVRSLDLADTVLMSSFNLSSIERSRTLAPEIATGWLLVDVGEGTSLLDLAVQGGHIAVHPPVARTSRAFIESAHSLGIRVNTWTVDDPIRMDQLLGDGIDGLITNVPAVARQAIRRYLDR